MIITWVGLGWVHGCLDSERDALLQLKPVFKYLFWPMEAREETSSDCCRWEMVDCDVVTGRITNLSLAKGMGSELPVLNVSQFLPFVELKILDLSSNDIVGCMENKGFEILSSRLRKLEELNLNYNYFNDSIVSSLSGFASLKSLSLRGNQITPSTNSNGFGSRWRLSNLELLELRDNFFDNSILSSLRDLSSLKDLNLKRNLLNGTIDMHDLHNLVSLKKLDVSENLISDFKSVKGAHKRLQRSSVLEVLDLRDNFFNNSVLASLNEFSHLKSLNLSWNPLTGSVHLKELEGLRNLEELEISHNEVEKIVGPEDRRTLNKLKVLRLENLSTNNKGIVLESLGSLSSVKTIDLRQNILNRTKTLHELCSLSTVEELFLHNSSLHKDFLQSIESLTSLKVLRLKACGLKGTLPPQGWCELQNLQELDLSDNELVGTLPPCLANLTSIRTLDLSHNEFSDYIASSPVRNLKSIEALLLGYNHFQVTLKPLANHSSLKYFVADGNQLVEEAASQPWTPKFQLQALSLSNCIPKNTSARFLNFLYHQFSLQYLDLSSVKFGGAFPGWLFENNTRLEQIYLVDNSFVGPFKWPSHPNLNLSWIDISHNKLYGQIPSNISLIFPNLEYFALSGNSFQGSIPLSLGEMKSLGVLDLSNNQFSGEIQVLFTSQTQLWLIKLSNNNFSGRIPTSFASNLFVSLQMNGNKFVGEIPDLSSLKDLETLDLSRNSLSGKLPRWIANMSKLWALVLSNNHFEGPIPQEFCRLENLKFLDLSDNDLSGFIPSCLSELGNLAHVLLSRNRLRGPIPQSFVNISSLFALNIGDNNLNGPVPSWIGNFSSLVILLLQRNHFHGDIPIQLCQLNQLNILDLSSNNLYGGLHPCLRNLSSTITGIRSYELSFSIGYGGVDFLFERFNSDSDYTMPTIHEGVEFTTKSNSLDYTGYILDHMYGIDLSCNRFSGEIPPEFGYLVRSLNLSYNNLSGSIPTSFSNLKQLESLDLSYNDLSGRIPSQLIEVNTLAVFSVAHNNLSGPIPDLKAQFATFNASCYEGNPLLCGPPLNNNCGGETHSASPPTYPFKEESVDNGFMDMTFFWVTFVVTYTVALFGVVLVLYINSNWRHAWFYRVDVCFNACYYFVFDKFK
ncbi:receptor-like protein 15 [Tripterygium wilfordii]|uniref:receptor-like protein 15 n=1 Tax=Tripterygium wilfordii TaxID=458696 RepID=UPI0018F82996|nr:receptor-like protein 15 [Tripterygium wilfordii]